MCVLFVRVPYDENILYAILLYAKRLSTLRLARVLASAHNQKQKHVCVAYSTRYRR